MLSSLAWSYLIYLKLVLLAYRINDSFQHFSRNVREILDNQYPQRWIGRGGPHHWPARSPDLNHLSAAHKFRADLRVRIQEALFQLLKK
jgi:hypothetical protein